MCDAGSDDIAEAAGEAIGAAECVADLTLKRGGSSRLGNSGLERRVGAARGAWGEGRAGAVEHGYALAVSRAQQLMALAVDRRPENHRHG